MKAKERREPEGSCMIQGRLVLCAERAEVTVPLVCLDTKAADTTRFNDENKYMLAQNRVERAREPSGYFARMILKTPMLSAMRPWHEANSMCAHHQHVTRVSIRDRPFGGELNAGSECQCRTSNRFLVETVREYQRTWHLHGHDVLANEKPAR